MPTGLFLVLLVYFFMGTMTSVPGGDSAMFLGAAFSGGVSQPPGYPLITLIYKFLYLFPGESTTLLNFSSGIFNSLASLTLFFLFKRVLGCSYNALVIAFLFCALPLIYRYGIVAEVFALNNFLISLTYFLGLRLFQERNFKDACLGVFVMGLGMSNHHSFALIAFPLIIWLLVNDRNLLKPFRLFKLFGLGLLGLSPYLYLILAPSNLSEITWGETNTWNGFWHHFFRKDFGTFQLTSTGKGGLLDNLTAFFKDLPMESFGILILLPMAWIAFNLKKFKKDSFEHLIFFTFVFYIFFFFSLSNIDLSDALFKEVFLRFWQLPFLLLVLISGYGLSALNLKYEKLKKPIFYVIFIVVISRAGLSFHQGERRGFTIFEDYCSRMLKSLPEDSVLIATGDLQVNVLRFLQSVKKIRKDVVVLPIPLMDLPWYRAIHNKYFPKLELPPGLYGKKVAPGKYQLFDIALLNPQLNFYMMPDNQLVLNDPSGDISLLKTFQWVPYGFLFALKPKREKIDAGQVVKNHLAALSNFNPNDYRKMEDGSWENLVKEINYWNAERFHMIYHTRQLKKSGAKLSTHLPLAKHIEDLRKKYSPIPKEFLKNLGIIYYQLLGKTPGLREKLLSAWGEYYKRMDDKNSREGKEIKKALDHFGKRKK